MNTGKALLLAGTMLLGTQLAWAQTFTADLSGSNEVPPNGSPASGSVTAMLSGTTLSLSGSFSGLAGDYTASHIHNAPAGSNGGVVVGLTLNGGGSSGSYEEADNTFVLSPAEVDELIAGNFYVNVHSVEVPSGEIRGQLTRVQTSDTEDRPAAFRLQGAWPNPFNPETRIQFSLPESRQVQLMVHDMQGRRVTTLVDGLLQGGEHSVLFDAAGLASGVYSYTLSAEGQRQSGLMTLVK